MCSRMNHVEMDCDQEDIHGNQDYGDWLRASPNKLNLDRNAKERERRGRCFNEGIRVWREAQGREGKKRRE